MSNDLYLDTETFNEVPIKHGAHRYAEDAEVMLVACAWNEEPVDVWDTQDRPHWREELQEMIDYADRVVIHNSGFDRIVLAEQGVHTPVEKIEDTMVLALTHGLPAKLEMLGEVLGLEADKAKDKDGKRLIQLFTKPRPKNTKLRRATRETHPNDWQRFISYAGRDVDAMRSVHRLLPRWNWTDRERYLWRLDQAINDRGVAIDLDLADAAVGAFERDSRRMAALARELTGGAITSLTQRDRFLAYIRDKGVDLPDLTKGTIEAVLRDGLLPPDVLELLDLRRQAAATTPSKYQTLVEATSRGRMRGTVQFRGAARTGRDAGRIFQPQNLARCPDWFDGEVQELTIAAFKAACEDILFDDVADRCVYAVRGTLVAEKGKKLLIADLSNIEGRVLAWLAKEDWKIEAFKAYDRGEGPDLYKATGGRILGKDPTLITKEERQLYGKTPELSGGYGGGVGAYRVMGGAVFDAMSDEQIQEIVTAWRAQHPATKRFWYAVEGAFRSAIRADEGDSFVIGDFLRFDRRRGPDGVDYVRIRLPSGRYLSYRNARINDDSQIIYEGLNQYTRKWEDIETYYGKLCLAEGTLVLTDAGWLPIEAVTPQHKVWDGIEWVCQQGVVCNGVSEVRSLNGVWMTPDHEVLTTKGWRRASQCQGFERADPRIPEGFELRGQRWEEIAVDARMCLRNRGGAARDRDNEAAETGRKSIVRLQARPDYSREKTHTRNVGAQGLRGLAQHARPLHASVASGLAQLRRAWDHGLRAMARFVHAFLGRYGVDVRRGHDARTEGQLRGVFAGELRLGDTQTTSAQPAGQRLDKYSVGPGNRSRSGGAVGVEQVDPLLSSEHGGAGQFAFRAARQRAKVYDLVNCGPRNRFVVCDPLGRAMIVHNCENVVQAASCDVFHTGMIRAERAGYRVVLRVHDELVCEVPDSPEYTVDALCAFMAALPTWAEGLPLAAAGFEAYRYRKE